MGIQDRDYYKEWWQKKTGYVERARFRLPEPKPRREWHWSLIAIVWGFVFVVLFGFISLFVPKAHAETIYLCKAYNGSTFWAKAHCNQHNALIERIVSVPDGMPFDQQVEGARGGVSAAQARQHAEENHVQRNQRCVQLQRERNQIDSRYTNWQWQPPEVINPDQQRYRAIRSELQRLGCSMQ